MRERERDRLADTQTVKERGRGHETREGGRQTDRKTEREREGEGTKREGEGGGRKNSTGEHRFQ